MPLGPYLPTTKCIKCGRKKFPADFALAEDVCNICSLQQMSGTELPDYIPPPPRRRTTRPAPTIAPGRAARRPPDSDAPPKHCANRQCEQVNPQPLTEFYRGDGTIDGRRTKCKSCVGEARRRQNEANPETRQRYHLNRNHHITLEQFNALLLSQGGRCACCRTTEPGGMGTFHVDHDHTCCASIPTCGNCIRGLLCNQCNRGMGCFRDDPDVVEAAARYLRDYEESPDVRYRRVLSAVIAGDLEPVLVLAS
jgi:hypothetical protein